MGDERKQDDEEKFDDVQCYNQTEWRLNIKPVIVKPNMLWMMMMMVVVVVNIPCASADDCLRVDFYNTSCPDVEGIILNAVTAKLQASPKAGSGVLRLFFHDAFVSVSDQALQVRPTYLLSSFLSLDWIRIC